MLAEVGLIKEDEELEEEKSLPFLDLLFLPLSRISSLLMLPLFVFLVTWWLVEIGVEGMEEGRVAEGDLGRRYGNGFFLGVL